MNVQHLDSCTQLIGILDVVVTTPNPLQDQDTYIPSFYECGVLWFTAESLPKNCPLHRACSPFPEGQNVGFKWPEFLFQCKIPQGAFGVP